MKRLRSYGDDLGSASEKELDRDRTASFLSSHHRRFYLKTAENGRSRSVIDNNLDRDTSRCSRKRIESNLDGFNDRDGSRSLRKRLDHDSGDNLNDRDGLRGTRKRLDHDLDCFDDREGSRISRKGVDVDFPDNFDERAGSRVVRKRFEHENDGFDRMNGLDRHRERDGSDRGGRVPSLVSPRDGHAGGRPRYRERDKDRDKIHRSESFCTGRRDFPRGFRLERDRLKGEESVSSWHRFGSRSKRDGDEEVKSSAGETAASSSSRGGMDGGSSRESVKSPQKSKDVRSPTWSKESKDSGGESLKTVKKNKSLASESGGSSNGTEIEEGELQPDPHPEPEPHSASVQAVKHVAELEDMVDVGKDTKQNDSEFCQNMESTLASTVKLAKEGNVMSDKEVDNENEQDGAEEAAEEDVLRESDKLLISHNNSRHKVSVGDEVKASEGNDSGDASDNENWKKDHPEFSAPSHCKLDNHGDEEGIDSMCMPKPLTSTQEENLANGIDLEVGVADVNVPDPSENMVEDDPKVPELNMHTIKDKGKGVALCCSPDEVNFMENGNLIERNFIAWRDDAMEGPSSRGFELFWTCAKVKQPRLPEDEHEMKKLEPLDLSLGLPNVSLPAPSNNAAAPPNSPPHARSVQSLATTFRTGSDCFTTSISFSGSQFIHNPSCSLTHNSLDCDYERSVKSRPLFQDVDWEAQNADDSKHKELPTIPKLVSNSNGSLHLPHGSQGMLSSQAMQGQHGMLFGLDGSGSFQRQHSGIKTPYQDDARSPTHSVRSHDNRSECGRDKKQAVGEESGSKLFRSSNQREIEQVIPCERDFVERIIGLVISEPIQTMSWRIHELSEQAVARLKEVTSEMIVKEEKRGKLRAFQEVLKNRSDLTLEALLRSQHVQLEILVALKTGITDFLMRADDIPLTDLAEIFLNFKCRNLNCRSALPVDECDCKFCLKKDGFCSTCMCLICSKFDMASNTCSWVGCDVCSHWCHTDCGLQNSSIRNGCSVTGTQGTSEMQFYCIACGHPSEMFGFVKDVFKVCASVWKAETMLKELEYVRRIFSVSSDARGKLLRDVATQLLARLQNGSSVVEIYNHIMGFLAESDSKYSNASKSSRSEPQALQKNKGDESNRAAGLNREAFQSKSVSLKNPSQTTNVRTCPMNTDRSPGSGGIWDSEVQMSGKNKPVIVDELESIVKIKQAEAQMFQKRADDARREAESLKRIALAKNEKIEEEFSARITKLHLAEAEDRRQQKLEELHGLERSHREYFDMKTRMEAGIKDLLLKIETTKRNLIA